MTNQLKISWHEHPCGLIGSDLWDLKLKSLSCALSIHLARRITQNTFWSIWSNTQLWAHIYISWMIIKGHISLQLTLWTNGRDQATQMQRIRYWKLNNNHSRAKKVAENAKKVNGIKDRVDHRRQRINKRADQPLFPLEFHPLKMSQTQEAKSK